MTEISQALLDRGRSIWDELTSQCGDSKLPFVLFDPKDPEVLLSAWHAEDSGDEFEDLARGVCFAQLLVHRAKMVRGNFDPFQVIEQVLFAIATKGNPGVVERGFLSRISMLALAASLN